MLGDSFRRLQADELDAEWDRLVRGELTSGGDPLMRITTKLEAMIPAATPGADVRVHRKVFRESPAPLMSTRSRRMRSMELQSAPLNLPRTAPAKRWWSSPVAALEAIVACLIIAALALGISVYQSNDRGPSDRSFTAAESTPAPTPTPDWIEFNAMRAAALPTLTSWDGQVGAGELMLNLVGVNFPEGTGFSGNYTGVALVSALDGTVAVTIDSGEPIILSKGETASAFVAVHLGIRNAGTETANMVLGRVYEPSLMSSFTTDEPDRVDYFAYFLGNALIDAPSGPTEISLEVFDETTMNRSTTSNAAEIFASSRGPITFIVRNGEAGIRGTETTAEEYRTGGGYEQIAIGTTSVFDSTEVLIRPGTEFDISAPVDSDVLAYSLRVEAHPASGGVATPVAMTSVDSE